MHGMGMFLARSGFVASRVDYRLMDGSENLCRYNWTTYNLRYVGSRRRRKYGVDPDHIGAFGHSSGAQLAALSGMEETHEIFRSSPREIFQQSAGRGRFDGPTDFTTHGDFDADTFLTAFFGGGYVHHPAVWQDASPVFTFPGSFAVLIVHGTHDENVPIAQAQGLADKLKQAGFRWSL